MSIEKVTHLLRRLRSPISLTGTVQNNNFKHIGLNGNKDKGSVTESIRFHEDLIASGRREVKNFNTQDTETITIYENIRRTNSWLDSHGLYPTSNKTGLYASKVIKISDIEEAPESYKEKLEEARAAGEISRFFIGGPSAESAAVLFSKLKQNPQDKTKFRVGKISESNATHSSSQHHRRHASAINIDSERTGHAMIPHFTKRFICPPELPEILESDFTKIDLFAHNISIGNIPIYVGNELHWAKNRMLHLLGMQTEHNTNVLMATDDKDIADAIFKFSGRPLLSDHQKKSNIGIHIVTNDRELKNLEREHRELFSHTNVRFNRLSEDEMINLFGEERHNIKAAFRYEGDCMALYNAYQTYKEIAESNDVDWQENKEVQRLYIKKSKTGEPTLVGIGLKDLVTGEDIFEPANSVYLSLGYTNTYEYESSLKPTSLKGSMVRVLDQIYSAIPPQYAKPVPMHDIATGVSVNAIFKVDNNMRNILEENNGRYIEGSVSNSHWTLVALDENKNYALMRMTAGGNMASECYSAAYFLNLLSNTRRIYGDKLVGVVSTYGCPRSINAKNSGEFIKVCEGLVASYGHGGTGITKKNVTAAIALSVLGFGKEIETLHKECPYLFANYDISRVVHDHSERTRRRMGYDESFYNEEKIAGAFLIFTGMLAAISLVKQSSKENIEEKEKPFWQALIKATTNEIER